MPTIRTIDAKQGLELDGAPSPQVDTSAYRAAAQQGAALAGLGQDVQQIAAHYQRRQEQTEDFSARLGLQQQLQNIRSQDAEAMPQMQANGAGWIEQRTKAAQKQLDGFVSTLPPRLQTEFKQRASLAFGELEGDYVAQEVKQRTAWSVDNINTTAQGGENAVFANPEALEQQRAGMHDLIKAAPIGELEKQQAYRKVDEALEIARIKGLAQRDPEAAKRALGVQAPEPGAADDLLSGQPSAVRGNIKGGAPRAEYAQMFAASDAQTGHPGLAARIAQIESGQRANAKNPNSSAAGLFQFIDSTARRYGLGDKTNPLEATEAFTRLTLDNQAHLRKALGREPTAGELYLAHQQGANGAAKILNGGDRPVAEIVGSEAARLNGGAGLTAAQFARKWTSKVDGQTFQTPGMDGNLATPRSIIGDAPPGAQAIPFEKRQALAADIDRQARALEAQTAATNRQTYQARLNQLELDVVDGKAGNAELQQARAEWLNDAGDVQKVMGQIERRDREVTFDASAISALTDNTRVWDPTDSADKKIVDRVFDMGAGATKLAANDQQFVQAGLLPLIDRTGMVPKGARGTLAGMLRSSSPQTLDTALSIMDQIDRRNPVAFTRDMGDDAAKKLAVWRDRRAYDTPQAVADAIRKADDPATIKARQTLETQGMKLAAEKVSDSDIIGHFDPTFWPGDAPRGPADLVLGGQLRVEFNRLYAEQYSLTQDENAAKDQAFRRLSTVWGVSSAGGNRLMKNAPERFMPTIEGSHDWMRQQLADDLRPVLGVKTESRTVGGKGGAVRVTGGVQFDIDAADPVLVADDRTESLIARGERPSYGVQVKNKDGLLVDVRDGQNRLMRVTFDPRPYEAKAAAKLQQDRVRQQSYLDASGVADPAVYPAIGGQ